MDGRKDGWVNEIHKSKNARADGWMEEFMDRWMGSINRLMTGWMNG